MGQVALFLAEYEGRPLAGVMVFALGETAAYLYGASSNEERQRMPTYAVQWAAMEWAKARGCQRYDLWGIPDAPEEELETNFADRHDGLWGVYRFKRGFGGQVQRTVGAADHIYNKLVYKLYQWRRGR
jgi:peptidoglycan pentaglycine glycine transferase (the first glycine)